MFDIAGPYRQLSQSFILASLVEVGRTVFVDAYVVRSGETSID
jgi:acyl-CoA hydrolase